MRCWLGIDFFGEDFVAIVDYVVTIPHRSATFYDPPEGPEIEIHDIWLAQDFPGHLGPHFLTSGALFEHLAETLEERVCDHARNNYEPEPDYD